MIGISLDSRDVYLKNIYSDLSKLILRAGVLEYKRNVTIII